MNGDAVVNVADAVGMLDALFTLSSAILLCEDAQDVNADLLIDIADPVALLSYLFVAAPPPAAPFPACGSSLVRLGCSRSTCP